MLENLDPTLLQPFVAPTLSQPLLVVLTLLAGPLDPTLAGDKDHQAEVHLGKRVIAQDQILRKVPWVANADMKESVPSPAAGADRNDS